MVKKYQSFILLMIIVMIVLGCAHTVSGQIDEKEFDKIVGFARNIVFKQYPELDSESKNIIKDKFPYYKYHLISGNYAQYFIEWDITKDRFIRLSGTGNILKLENAKCEIIDKKQKD